MECFYGLYESTRSGNEEFLGRGNKERDFSNGDYMSSKDKEITQKIF